MSLWERLRQFELGWIGLAALTLAFVGVLFLRRLLPPGRRHRGKLSVLVLGLGPILHLVATGLEKAGAASVSSTLHLVNLFLVILGIAGTLSMVTFDLALGRTTIPTIIRDATQALVFALFVFIVLQSGGVDPLSIVTTSAVATAVIGLALQNTIANLFAGLLLQVEQTFKLGDWIQIGARVGKITEIRWRSSSLATRGGDSVILPNMTLLSQEVMNLSRPLARRQVTVKLPFHPRHSPGEIEGPVNAAVRSVAGVLTEIEVFCGPTEIGPGGETWIYDVKFWVRDVTDEGRVTKDVLRRVWYAASRAGLEMGAGRDDRDEAPRRDTDEHRAPLEQRGDDATLARRLRAAARVPLFATLSADEQLELVRGMAALRYGAGEIILHEKEPGDSLFVIEQGEVQVVAGEPPVEVATLSDGMFFGEMSLLTGEPRQATCVAVSETSTYEIDAALMRGLFARRPELSKEISELLAQRGVALADARELAPLSKGAMAERRTRLLQRMRSYFNLD